MAGDVEFFLRRCVKPSRRESVSTGLLSFNNLSPRLMKVRLTADMLRLRLDQSDVDALSSSGSVGFALPLVSDATLRCILRVDASADTIRAALTTNELAVTLPAEQAHRWMTGDAIGLEGQVPGAPATRILIEKDLGCRHTDDESERATSQTFDHLRE